MQQRIVISGTGFYAPEEVIDNQELVASFNQYVEAENTLHQEEIARGEREALLLSSVEFIEKASGIKRRHVINKAGILDPQIMHPVLLERDDSALSLQAEMAVKAAQLALQAAQKSPADIGGVILACSAMQRPFPAMAIEVQHALGIQGFAFDLNVACSSATFALQTAADSVRAGHARAVLVVNPELCTGQLNFRDRNSHFIFGDACTACVVELEENQKTNNAFRIISTQLRTEYSNNIRNNFGFLNRATPLTQCAADKLFYQDGRKVFKEVIPKVVDHIHQHLAQNDISVDRIKRFWLHQANSNMNRLIATKLLEREPTEQEAPIILDEYANTSSAGSIIAFHLHHADFAQGEIGLISSFGAGYSIGSVILQKI